MAVAATSSGQQQRDFKPKPVVVSQDPVTELEARTVFFKIETALRKVLPKMGKSKTALTGKKIATRAAIVQEMDRIFGLAKPTFQISPKPIPVDPSALTVPEPARSKLVTLVEWGCVNKLSPLAMSSKNTLGVLEFGDALGVFTARIAELSHIPSDRFSPDRMK